MEDNFIRLFMWGHQKNIQISFNVTAETLFNSIDNDLNPKLFFLGILMEECKTSHPICLEPENCGFSPENFSNLKVFAKNFEELDEENNIFHSLPEVAEIRKAQMKNRAYVRAVKEIINREASYVDELYYVSSPIEIEKYLVFTVLSLNKTAVNKHYSLVNDKRENRYRIQRSFIESVTSIFLDDCFDALKDYNNYGSFFSYNSKETLRKAGKNLMYTVAAAGENYSGLHGLYESCNEIASMKYEGAIGIGRMIIAPKGHNNIRLNLELKEPISMYNHRKVRKFLEISDNKSSIICDSALIYGLGEIVENYNPKEESIFTISFTSHFKWELFHNNCPLLVVEYREASLPKEKIDKVKFNDSLTRVFSNIQENQSYELWDIVQKATQQKHGTILVISSHAENEALRLENQSFCLNPLKLTDNIVKKISSIDGAVLIDPNLICYSIGVILDGLATTKGDSSRGARYNSAIRYFEFCKERNIQVLLIVVSEDGMINLIPNLKPRINHSDILSKIEELEKIESKENFSNQNFNECMNYFDNFKFYLTENECFKINDLRKKIEAKFSKELSETFKLIYNDLLPNDEMDDSYYL